MAREEVLCGTSLLLLLMVSVCLVQTYYFEDGYLHHYTYSSHTAVLGGTNVTTVVKFNIQVLNKSEDGITIHSLQVENFFQIYNVVYYDNPKNWNLKKHFLFHTHESGCIVLVHVHPEDEEEFVFIKKAVASIFSVTVKEKMATYETTELDHLGNLSHTYEVQETLYNRSISRSHYSHDRVERTHNKTLHYDARGTVQTAQAFDGIQVKKKDSMENGNAQLKQDSGNSKASGGFPIIWTKSETKLHLIGKRRANPHTGIPGNLRKESIHTSHNAPVYRLSEVRKNISENVKCVLDHHELGGVHRQECVQNIRTLLHFLQPDDYQPFAQSVLNSTCANSSTDCYTKRLMFIDIIARMGDEVSQKLIIKHVLNASDPDEVELEHVFLHCVALERPTAEFLETVSIYCFGTGESPEQANMTVNQRRACLAIGSLARNLNRNSNESEADALVQRIEAWIDKHENDQRHRQKRSLHFVKDHHYLTTKAVLIHALGNAGHQKSLHRIVNMTTPNSGHHLWRRVAIEALRHYSCEKSASAILESALRDSKESVRSAARHAYLQHPQSSNITQQQQLILLSNNYTWPSIARPKRSILDEVLFHFTLEIPFFSWKKEIGDEDVGASFGVHFENSISAVFRPLSGFVDVSIDDRLWAEAHVKPLDVEVDIVRVEACYKGRLEYNLNKFKDYTLGLAENLAGAFDSIAADMMAPMNKVTDGMQKQLHKEEGTPKKNFENITNAVKNLPTKTEKSLKSANLAMEQSQKLTRSVLSRQIQQVVYQAQSLVGEINTDVLSFFEKSSPAAQFLIPFGEELIADSFISASKILDKAVEFPRQSFANLNHPLLGFQLGLRRLFKGQNLMKEAGSSLKGKDPSDMFQGQAITNMISSLSKFINNISKRKKRKKRSTSPFGGLTRTNPFGGVDRLLKQGGDIVVDGLDTVLEHLIRLKTDMQEMRDQGPRDLQQALGEQKLAIDLMISTYEAFQKAIETIKSTLQALFGAKFNPKFPGQIRLPDESCGKGYYPSDTGSKYRTAGIDLRWNQGWKVISPVAGLVHVSGRNEITIEPTDQDFKQYEIIISNVEPQVNETNKFYKSAAVIGKSAGRNGCKDNHIHLAVKRRAGVGGSDLCFFIDPSPFVNTLKIVPEWQQECKHFTFKHIGNVIDFENIGKTLEEISKKVIRKAIDTAKHLLVKGLQKVLPKNSPIAKILPNIVEKLVSSSDVTNLFSRSGSDENLVNDVDVKNVPVDILNEMLSSVGDGAGVNDIIGNVASLMTDTPLANLSSFPIGPIGKFITDVGMSAVGGKSASKALAKSILYKACANFKNGYLPGHDLQCKPDEDCLGLTCNLKLPTLDRKVGLTVRADPVRKSMSANMNGKELQINNKGLTSSITGIKVESSTQWIGETANLVLSLLPCNSEQCFSPVRVFNNMQFREQESTVKQRTAPDIGTMDLESLMGHMAMFNLPGGEITKQVGKMFDGILSEASKPQKNEDESLDDEFQPDSEYEDSFERPPSNSIFVPFVPDLVLGVAGGPVKVGLVLSAGADFRISITADVKAVESTVSATLKPTVAARLKAAFQVDLLILKCGISLTAWLLDTGFPFKLEVNHSRLPVIERKSFSVELIPLRLELKVWVKFVKTEINHIIWEWSCPAISGIIWEEEKKKTENKPPRFPSCDQMKRSISGTCSVRQLAGRHAELPAFLLEVTSQDDSSTLKLDYSIGLSPGGRDVRSLVEMRGSTLTVPTTSLPNGVPLFWTVRARNTEGLEATVSCMLPTYDNTLPEGSITPQYEFTSHRTTIGANIMVSEDSELASRQSVAVGLSPGQFGKEVVYWEPLNLTKSGYGNEKKWSAFVRFTNLELDHGAQYFVNAKITNVLGYTSYLKSSGTLVDFTPPEPGPVGDFVSDILLADGCRAAVNQRCVDGNSELNHRRIVDGPGSETVLNGFTPFKDLQYTSSNNFISGHCHGFHDDESGIWGYTWSVGSEVCGDDVLHSNYNTIVDCTGLVSGLHLQDSDYYITFQAINNVVHGGSLVTTVCHSQPLTVDTTPPLVHEVGELMFDEDFDILGVYFNISDDGSGIARVDFALGRTKYDAFVRSYSHHAYKERAETFLVIQPLGLAPGVLAWVRIRAVNRVELLTAGHGDVPILIDLTAPEEGEVLDGEKIHQDIQYQHDTTRICAQWISFYDPESGIDHYYWGVGTVKRSDDVVAYHNFAHREKYSCNETTLHHNTTYYSTVIAFNSALNQKETIVASDGVLVDITPPLQGYVHDGLSLFDDIDYSSKTATIESVWDNFTDPESHVPIYSVTISINDEVVKTFNVGNSTTLVDHTSAFKHLDYVHVNVTATNGAELDTLASSDGYLIDETPPVVISLKDSVGGRFQSDASSLNFSWHFIDEESGVTHCTYTVFQRMNGQKIKFWPTQKPSIEVLSEEGAIHLDNLSLKNGALYTVRVTALNGAFLATKIESFGVMIDSTRPTIKRVSIGVTGEEEELDELGNVLHLEGENLHVAWIARDEESGIMTVLVCSTNNSIKCTADSDFTDYHNTHSATLSGRRFLTSQASPFYVVIRVINGAGLSSDATSRPIIVQKTNEVGIVNDGRNLGTDLNYQQDLASLSMSFSGFGSEACGLTGYDWGIGTSPFSTDIMRFTNYGLTSMDGKDGFAEISITNKNNEEYFVTVRAITGENCIDTYLVASSDGLMVDHEKPDIHQYYETTEIEQNVIFQNHTDYLPISWTYDEQNGMNYAVMIVSGYDDVPVSRPIQTRKVNIDDVDLNHGRTYFVKTTAIDMAGNENTVVSPPITMDTSPPDITGFACTKYMSRIEPLVICKWENLQEKESKLRRITTRAGFDENHLHLIFSRLLTDDTQFEFDARPFIEDAVNSIRLVVAVVVENEAAVRAHYRTTVLVDYTPPTSGTVQVLTSNSSLTQMHECQIQQTFIILSVNGFSDDETDIKMYQVAIGTKRGLEDIHPYTEVTIEENHLVVADLNLPAQTLVHISLKVFNNVGLFTIHDSEVVNISPDPYVVVTDGEGSLDIDYQHDLSVIQGSWTFSDPCPVLNAEWALYDIDGNTIKEFQNIPDNGQFFYNDELVLSNMVTYTVTVRITDSLNRTFIASSNGVTTEKRRPVPGFVRDGFSEDVDYQQASDYLAANWDNFGIGSGKDPSQQVLFYEVAVGNNPRVLDGRSNVHYYENVGSNTSYVFQNLNLVKKSVVYFISVKAHSAVGSVQESFSDGVCVGYDDEIVPGKIVLNPFQSSTRRVVVSWTPFVSDFEIYEYEVAIHNSLEYPKESNQCIEMSFVPLVSFMSSGRETLLDRDNLQLNHSATYYVIVKTRNEAGICKLAASSAVTIDCTPPSTGAIVIKGGQSNGMMYAKDTASLHISLHGFADNESEIANFFVQILGGSFCSGNYKDSFSARKDVLQSINVSTPSVHIYDIHLDPTRVYYIHVVTFNKAGLSSLASSLPIIVDLSRPVAGDIMVGQNMHGIINYWSKTDYLEAKIAMYVHPGYFDCKLHKDIMLNNNTNVSVLKSDKFNPDMVIFRESSIEGFGRLGPSLVSFEKGGIQIFHNKLHEGPYSFTLRPATGFRISTVLAFAYDAFPDPDLILDKLYEPFIENCTNSSCQKMHHSFSSLSFGLLFTDEESTQKPLVIFWTISDSKLSADAVNVDFTPHEVYGTYTFQLFNRSATTHGSMDVALLINGEIVQTSGGLGISENMTLNIFTWNNYGYLPTVIDPFSPFSSSFEITSMKVPLINKACTLNHYSDSVSGIKDIFVGLSDSQNISANIIPYENHVTFCIPCDVHCIQNCNFPNVCHGHDVNDLQIINLLIGNLSLEEPVMVETEKSTDAIFNAYFIDVKVVDHAGFVTESKSNAILIDVTPPEVSNVTCHDPEYSLSEVSFVIGSDNSVSASWSVLEDMSDIISVWVGLGTQCGYDDLLTQRLITQGREVTLKMTESRFKQDIDYFVSVTAYNSAGLNMTSCCEFTADFRVPVPTSSEPKPLFPVAISDEREVDELVDFSIYTDRIGLQWDAPVSNVEYIEWELSTDDNIIYPSMIIGGNSSIKVAIVQDHIVLDDFRTDISLSEFMCRNVTNGMQSSDLTNGPLALEPGKCYYQTVACVSRGHKRRDLPKGKPTCIKREHDVVISHGRRTLLELYEGGINILLDKDKQVNNTVIVNLKSGGLMLGSLCVDDLDAPYGAPAAPVYIPYIVSPSLTHGEVSRFLKERIDRWFGIAFFITPLGDLGLEDDIIASLEGPKKWSRDMVEMALLFWDSQGSVWRHIGEVCGQMHHGKMEDPVYLAQICIGVFRIAVRKSLVENFGVSMTPRMFHWAELGPIINTAPVIKTEMLSCSEDDGIVALIAASDGEDDDLVYYLWTAPLHGEANITLTGELHYIPDENFNGIDEVEIRVTEKLDDRLDTQPFTIRKRILLNVSSTNDEPMSFFQSGKGEMVISTEQSKHIRFLEGNRSSHDIGSLMFADVDEQDELTVLEKRIAGDDAYTTFIKIPEQMINVSTGHIPAIFKNETISAYKLELRTSRTYHGHLAYSALSHDKKKAYSPQLTIDLFVLINPCVHGVCQPAADLPCQHKTRAVTFDPYLCRCDAGYSGRFCSIDIDDCANVTCPALYDCEDQVAYHECVLNYFKVLAVCLGVLVPALALIVILYRRRRMKKWRPSGQSSNMAGIGECEENRHRKSDKDQGESKSTWKPLQDYAGMKFIDDDGSDEDVTVNGDTNLDENIQETRFTHESSL